MDTEPLRIQMLGEFSLRLGDIEVNDSGNRSWKVWLLLAYMIYSRKRPVTQEELVELLWGEEERSSNPRNALKTIFHRVRSCLNQLDGKAGHELILRQEGTYAWNTAVPVTLDIDEFEAACRAGSMASTPDEKLGHWLRALSLYRGAFLSKLSSEAWVVPISAYYHNLYVRTVLEALPLLERQERWQDVADLCRSAVEQESYMEELYNHLMTALIRLGDQREAVSVYESMSELMLSQFGLMPSGELRTLYHEALRFVDDRTLSPDMILDQLRETDSQGGALFCDYDFFRAIYHSVARLIARSGDAFHLALISIAGSNNTELPRRSLDRVVNNLHEIIRTQLRRGDVFARCSVSQFVLLLPQANYEDSCMVCRRIIRAFGRQYSHSPAELHFSVQPLEPNT